VERIGEERLDGLETEETGRPAGTDRAAGAAPVEGLESIDRCLLPGDEPGDDVEGIASAVREEDRLREDREGMMRAAAEAAARTETPPEGRTEESAPPPPEDVVYRVRFARPVCFRESRTDRIRRRALTLFIAVAGLAGGWGIGHFLWTGPLEELLLPEIADPAPLARRHAVSPAQFYGPPAPEAPEPSGTSAGPRPQAPATVAPAESGTDAGGNHAASPSTAPTGGEGTDGTAGPGAPADASPARGALRGVAMRASSPSSGREADRNRAVRALARSIDRAVQGDRAGALRDAERAWEIDPSLAGAANQAAALSLSLGRWAEAERWSRSAVAADRNHVAARNNLGAALVEQGRAEEAARVYAAAIRMNGTDWRAWAGLAAALEEGGRYGEAVEAHTRAVHLASGRPELRYNRALALEKAGKVEEAAGSFRAYLALAGGSDPVRENRVRLWLADRGL